MSVPLFVPPSYIQLYAFCIDDSLPKFKPDSWIKKNRLYKVKHYAESLNTDSIALTVMDKDNNIIHPSPSMSAFKIDRFELMMTYLN